MESGTGRSLQAVSAARCWQQRAGWLVYTALIGLAGCAVAPVPSEVAVDIERRQLEHALAPGTAQIEIDNPWGDIYIRRNDERAIYVHAVIQHIGVDPPGLTLTLSGDDAHAILATGLDGAGRDCHRQRPGGGRLGRVDLTVLVPIDVNLSVRSDCDGRVNTDHVRGDLQARTSTGAIRASVSGQADLHSASGPISAFLELDSPVPSEVDAAGAVTLTLPPAVRAQLVASACGELRSVGFQWQSIERHEHCWRGQATLGEAASQLIVASRKSNVELRLRGAARP